MNRKEQKQIILMNFSGIYEQEEFWRGKSAVWVDVRGLPGSSCYCDDDAGEILMKKTEDLSPGGIHFLDSGNYHYMTFFWLQKIRQPFRLLVFDNHTDMQPPAFGDILSCGGWIEAALNRLPCLKQVILAGPDEEAWARVEEELTVRVSFFSRERLRKQSVEEKLAFFRGLPTDLPLYISVDKDVLCEEDACTDWSQGDMKLEELLAYLECVREKCCRKEIPSGKILGMDVCGECDMDLQEGSLRNDIANRALLQFFLREG